ncbi:hypothetical protein DSM104299_01756 [Baekduia alba]|nr:hypothetical protein DSM104299_01756 [Baekduia alba]
MTQRGLGAVAYGQPGDTPSRTTVATGPDAPHAGATNAGRLAPIRPMARAASAEAAERFVADGRQDSARRAAAPAWDLHPADQGAEPLPARVGRRVRAR